jgi:hypothetical protein
MHYIPWLCLFFHRAIVAARLAGLRYLHFTP